MLSHVVNASALAIREQARLPQRLHLSQRATRFGNIDVALPVGLRSEVSGKHRGEYEFDVSSMLVNINKKLDSLLCLKETVEGIERFTQHMSDMDDELLIHVQQQDRDNKELNARVRKIEETRKNLQIEQLREEVNDLD